MLDVIASPALPRLIPVTPAGIAARLADLRRDFEQSEDWPDMQVEAALFLSDVCAVLGLAEAERLEVLGRKAAAYVAAIEEERLTLAPNVD